MGAFCVRALEGLGAAKTRFNITLHQRGAVCDLRVAFVGWGKCEEVGKGRSAWLRRREEWLKTESLEPPRQN